MLYIPARSVPSRSNLRAAVGLTVVPDVGLAPYPSRACDDIRITRHGEVSIRGRRAVLDSGELEWVSLSRRGRQGVPSRERSESGRPPRALGIWPTAWTARRRSNLRPPTRRQRASIPLRRSPLSARTLPPHRRTASTRLSRHGGEAMRGWFGRGCGVCGVVIAPTVVAQAPPARKVYGHEQRTAGRAADRLSGCGRPLEAISRHRREHKLWLWLTGFRAAGSDASSREH